MFAVTSLCQMTNSVGMKRCYATSVEWLWRWLYTEEWRFGIWFGWATCAFWTHPVSRHGLPPFQHVLLDLALVRIPDVYEWDMMCLSRTWSISGSERLMACFLVLCSDWHYHGFRCDSDWGWYIFVITTRTVELYCGGKVKPYFQSLKLAEV